ncbi:MAG: DUF4290 domain-containing protein [Saprospiraceae bacterium]
MVNTIHGLEYNSERENLTIAEYGRHVQKLINHCKAIEHKEERQEFAEAIIDLMYQMNPTNKMVLEYRLRLWKHFFKIANYDIDVTAPEGVITTNDGEKTEVIRLPYHQSEFRFRHYGYTIQLMVKKAIEMEDEEMKQEYTNVIAAYMKLAYRTWNKEHYVNDEIIKSDLKAISKGALVLSEDYVVGNLTPMNRKLHTTRSSSRNGRSSNNRNRNSGRNSNRNHSNNNSNRNKNNRKRK